MKALLRRFESSKHNVLQDNLDGEYYRSASGDASDARRKRDMGVINGTDGSGSPETGLVGSNKKTRFRKGRASQQPEERPSDSTRQITGNRLGELQRNLFSGASIGNIEHFHLHVHFDEKRE